MGNQKIDTIPVRNRKIKLTNGKETKKTPVKGESVFTTGTNVKESVAPAIKPPVEPPTGEVTKNRKSGIKKTLQKIFNKDLLHKKKFWIGTLGLMGLVYLSTLYKQEYDEKNNVVQADESAYEPDTTRMPENQQEILNELDKIRKSYPVPEQSPGEMTLDPIERKIYNLFHRDDEITLNITDNESDDKEYVPGNKIENIDSVLKSVTAPNKDTLVNVNFDYSKFSTTDLSRQIDDAVQENIYNNYKNFVGTKTADKKNKSENKKDAVNPMVVKNANVTNAKDLQTKQVSKPAAKAQTTTRSNADNDFIKKYLADFMQTDFVFEPVSYEETMKSFFKECGYKPTKKEIDAYVIAKRGDCVSKLLTNAAEKEFGRSLTRKEKEIIANISNNIVVRRKTQVKNATNDLIMPGDTISIPDVRQVLK